MERCWSVWLMPDNEGRDKYRNLIRFFSSKYNSPIFQPHVTLYGGLDIDPQSTFSFFKKLILRQNYFTLVPIKIESKDPPWKTLIISLKEEKALSILQNKIHDKFKIYKDYNFDPHLSLAYGDISIKESERDSISLDESIRFSDVSLVMTSGNINNWNVIKTFQLK